MYHFYKYTFVSHNMRRQYAPRCLEEEGNMSIQLVIILILAVGVGFLAWFVIKSLITPTKIDGIGKLLKQGKTAAAIKLGKNLAMKNPRDAETHYLLGKAYLADKKPELALMEFKIVNQNALFGKTIPEAEFRKTIAQLYIKYNQPEEALKEYLLLVKLEPGNAEYYYNIGSLFEKRERSDQAFGYYQKAIEANPKHIKAHAALGLLLYRGKQIPRSIIDCCRYSGSRMDFSKAFTAPT